jgi:ribosomal protein S27AE
MIIKFKEFLFESHAYQCATCGERAEHEEIEDNPNLKCGNCGDSDWETEHDE